MPIKQVFQTAKAAYPLTTRVVPRTGVYAAPDGGLSYFYLLSPTVDSYRIYTEYFWFFRGLFTLRSPDYPGEFEIHLITTCNTDAWPSWSVVDAVWNGKTGDFLGLRTTITSFTIAYMFAAPDGTIWATNLDLQIYKINPVDWSMTLYPLTINQFGANIGATTTADIHPAIDPARDLAILRVQGDTASQLSVCRFSTGDWLRRINLAGNIQFTFIASPPMAYAVEETGNMTAFNYETGEVMGVLHTGLVSGGFTWADTAFTWDPFLRRVLFCHKDPDTLPNGDCNTLVKGYYPVPLPVGMTPPIPLRYPQKGKTVPVWSRVYGGAAEGIVGQDLSYTVGSSPAATVNPSRKATENNGTVVVQLTGSLAGANSIAATTSVP